MDWCPFEHVWADRGVWGGNGESQVRVPSNSNGITKGRLMSRIGRREFVGSALVGGAGLLALHTANIADARIEVLINEPIGTISPEIYGHFIEHLGGVIYDGVWVGEQSKSPNIGGIRKALVEHMRRIKPGVLRWPGGGFAGRYNWHDGVGPTS